MSDFKICADGGANRLLEASHANEGPPMQPSLIIGDMDSLRADVLKYYKDAGVPLIDLSEDQDSTDLQKCLAYLQAHVLPGPSLSEEVGLGSRLSDPGEEDSQTRPHQIFVLGAFGGRIDHTLNNLNTLYQFRHLDIILWGEGNLVRLVRGPGETTLRPERGVEGPSCGLVCLGEASISSSRGMKWDLDETRMNIGGLISTCNKILADELWVNTDKDLLWITTIKESWPEILE